MNNQIDISPRKQQLKAEYDLLQKQYADLVTERDDLDLERPRLEALYMETVGQLQYEMLMLQKDVAKLRQYRDMLQACINRGEQPDWDGMEIKLKFIVQEIDEKLKQEEEKLKQAREFIRHEMEEEEHRSDAEKLELKTLYKRLVHRLHPDLHPDQTEWERNLFLKVQEAYFKRDLERLRQLEQELEAGIPSGSESDDTIEVWEERIAKLRARIAAIQDEIKQILSSFPFTYRDKVYDAEWVAARKEELLVQKAQLMLEKDRLEKIIVILEDQCRGQSDS